MGYTSEVRGEITITPPLKWSEVKGHVMLGGWDDGNQTCLRLRLVTDEPVETDEGLVVRKYVDAVVPVSYDPFKAYSIVEDLQLLVDQFGADHVFDYRLRGTGSGFGDLWQVMVREGKAVKDVARVVWPDGSEEPQR